MELNINKEFVDVIAEKFGMFIDWSVENVYPQVMEILMRYRTYELATHGGYTIISIVLLLYTFFSLFIGFPDLFCCVFPGC